MTKIMRLTIKQDGKVQGVWVAKTKRGFNRKQRKEILAAQLALKPATKLSEAETLEVIPRSAGNAARVHTAGTIV